MIAALAALALTSHEALFHALLVGRQPRWQERPAWLTLGLSVDVLAFTLAAFVLQDAAQVLAAVALLGALVHVGYLVWRFAHLESFMRVTRLHEDRRATKAAVLITDAGVHGLLAWALIPLAGPYFALAISAGALSAIVAVRG